MKNILFILLSVLGINSNILAQGQMPGTTFCTEVTENYEVSIVLNGNYLTQITRKKSDGVVVDTQSVGSGSTFNFVIDSNGNLVLEESSDIAEIQAACRNIAAFEELDFCEDHGCEEEGEWVDGAFLYQDWIHTNNCPNDWVGWIQPPGGN